MNEIEKDLHNEPQTVEVSEDGMIFRRYGRLWYTTKREAKTARRFNERVLFDKGMNAYYIIRPKTKKSIWDF